MINIRTQRALAIILTFMVAAIAVVIVALNVSLTAAEEGGTQYAIELRLSTGENVPIAEITVFGAGSWSYTVDEEELSGTFFFGNLPPRPDPVTDKVAMIEVSSDDGASGFLAVFKRFPAGATLLLHRDDKLFTEATITYNPEEL